MRMYLVLSTLFLCLLVLTSSNLNAQCDNRATSGLYGFTITGFIISGTSAEPASAVGKFHTDGQGNVLSGSETRSANGVITKDLTFTGTYTVNADCTASTTWNLSNGAVEHYDFVILARADELDATFTDSGTVLTGIAKRRDKQATQ